jgi:tRNA1Val (adenine37-N6)-methyltransferase
VNDDLTDDLITRDFRIWQRAKGHRFSSDDVVTAWTAWNARPEAKRVCDLGCGIGSVLLMMAWRMPDATFVGVEAQDVSFALLEKNVARNELNGRVQVHHGDLRADAIVTALGSDFDLVTGTPPYFPPGAALDAEDEQRAYARIEYRGGVEAYLATGARVLSQNGTMVLCGEGAVEPRVRAGAAACGLFVVARCEVFAHATAGKPLFCVWTLKRTEDSLHTTALLLRGEDGKPTDHARALRAFSGFGP